MYIDVTGKQTNNYIANVQAKSLQVQTAVSVIRKPDINCTILFLNLKNWRQLYYFKKYHCIKGPELQQQFQCNNESWESYHPYLSKIHHICLVDFSNCDVVLRCDCEPTLQCSTRTASRRVIGKQLLQVSLFYNLSQTTGIERRVDIIQSPHSKN